MSGFVIVLRPDGYRGIRCLRCDKLSWNANDVHFRFCGYCRRFHDYEWWRS